jgi:hypothetical protein
MERREKEKKRDCKDRQGTDGGKKERKKYRKIKRKQTNE